MTKQLLLSILTTFLVATEIYGQTDTILKKNEIGFGVGLYQATMKNVLVSDLQHSGNQFPSVQLIYRRNGLKNFHNLQITYSNIKLYSSFRQNYTTDIRPTLNYTYLRKVNIANKSFSYFIGTTFFCYASFRDVRFNNEDLANNYNTEYTSMLSLSSMAKYEIGKNLLEAQVNFGLLSLNQRTGYANRVASETNWQVQTIPTFNEYSFRIAYTRSLSKRFNVRAEYNYQFHSFEKPEYLGYSNNRFYISTSFKF